MAFHRAAPAGAVCAFFVAAISATPVSFPPAPVAVRAAIHEVWAASPQVRQADAERRAALARADAAAQPLYNPSIQLEGENADVDRRTVGASLALDVTGKRRARMVEGDAEVRMREAAFAVARRDVAADWLKASTGAAYAREQRALGERRVALMRRFDELAEQRLRVGDIGAPERDLAALALGEAEIQQASLASQEAGALAAMAAIDGGASRRPADLSSSTLPDGAAVVPVDAEDRPDLRLARAQQDRADAGVAVAQRARLPDPTVSLTGGRVRSGPRTDRVVGLSVAVPLPLLNSRRADIAAARADADAAFASRHAVALRSEATLVQARATYLALRNATVAFRQSRAAAFDERADTLGRLWQAGEIGTSDYLVQLKQSLDTALAGLALESQAWQAWFDYLAAAGRLTGWIDGTSQEPSA